MSEMIIGKRSVMKSSFFALTAVLAGALAPGRLRAQADVPITFNADVQVTKLNPNATGVGIGCYAMLPVAVPSLGTLGMATNMTPRAGSPMVPVSNRAYSGVITATVGIPQAILAIPANRTLTFVCRLRIYKGSGYVDAIANAAQPQNITQQNYNVVGVSSMITWTQDVTFQ